MSTHKVIITAAISGAEVTQEMNPAVPYTIEQYVREAKLAYEAGAAIIHLHARFDDGTPTQDRERFRVLIDAIQKACPDAIIQPSTGGATGMTAEERLQPTELNPEMASLDCGTMNFGGDDIFVNTENLFDKSHVDMALRLVRKRHIKPPLHFNFVLGVNGGATGTPRDLLFLKESIPADSTFTVTGVGRCQLDMNVMGMLLGGHVRVGFEDNLKYNRERMGVSNAEFVERIVRIAKELNLEIATPAEARQILGMPGRVN